MTDRTLSAGDGFTVEVLHIYARGPNDPPGNQRIYICNDCRRSRAQGHADGCPNIPKPQPVAVPTTLSAAALDALDATRADEPDGTWSLTMTEAQHNVIMAMARRTEAADRKLAAVDAVLTAFPAEWTVFKRDIRRALAED
jgi:hypothetical protein